MSNSDYAAAAGWDTFPLSEGVRLGIRDLGWPQPTPVQAEVVRPILAGKDLIVRSKTGTGKTGAFGVPLIEKAEPGRHKVQALVLAPTRELALQVHAELALLGKHKDLRFVAIYGGASMGEQLAALRQGVDFVVGTPGRVLDHIERRTLDLSTAWVGVLDEADEMLDQGFYLDVCRILDRLPSTRQTLLFSATVSDDVENLIKKYTRDPEMILLSGDEYTVEGIDNVMYHTVDDYPKPRNLLYLIEREEPDAAIVFCNTRSDTELVTAVLNRNGYDAEMLNGDMAQKDRERVMGKVKRGELRFMVATDLAARGIDISDLSHVINYSLPEDPAVYLHRVGRTGRIGKHGTAISIVSGRELVTLTALEKKYKIVFEERKLPTPDDAQRMWTERHVQELREAMQSGGAFDAFLALVKDLKSREGGELLLATALRSFFHHHRMEKVAERAVAEHKVEKRHQKEQRAPRPAPVTEPAPTPVTEPAPELEVKADSVRLWVNLGTADGLKGAEVAAAIAELAKVPTAFVLEVDARRTHSFMFVEPVHVEAILAANNLLHGGKPVQIERARKQ